MNRGVDPFGSRKQDPIDWGIAAMWLGILIACVVALFGFGMGIYALVEIL